MVVSTPTRGGSRPHRLRKTCLKLACRVADVAHSPWLERAVATRFNPPACYAIAIPNCIHRSKRRKGSAGMSSQSDLPSDSPPLSRFDDHSEAARQFVMQHWLRETLDGLLPEQPDLSTVYNVLDVACGAG